MDSKNEDNLKVVDLENEPDQSTTNNKPIYYFRPQIGYQKLIEYSFDKDRPKNIRNCLFDHKLHHTNHVKVQDDSMPILKREKTIIPTTTSNYQVAVKTSKLCSCIFL